MENIKSYKYGQTRDFEQDFGDYELFSLFTCIEQDLLRGTKNRSW